MQFHWLEWLWINRQQLSAFQGLHTESPDRDIWTKGKQCFWESAQKGTSSRALAHPRHLPPQRAPLPAVLLRSFKADGGIQQLQSAQVQIAPPGMKKLLQMTAAQAAQEKAVGL